MATKKYRYGYLLTDLSQKVLWEHLSYSKSTGLFVRLTGTNIGQVAGSRNPNNSNIQIRVLGKLYLAHRLAWLYVNGVWPEDEIDHRDGDRSNNRWRNLRAATHAENHQNEKRRTDNTSGCTGVNPLGRKWLVRIQLKKERHLVGIFDNLEEAIAARVEAKAKIHEFQPTDREPPCSRR